MPFHRFVWLYVMLPIGLTGCMSVTSTHTVADPAKVERVTVWASPHTADSQDRYAVLTDQAAKTFVRCMVYERQDNPFYPQIIGAFCLKGSSYGDVFIEQTDGACLHVNIEDNRLFFWDHSTGSFTAPYKDLDVALRWKIGTTPMSTTRP